MRDNLGFLRVPGSPPPSPLLLGQRRTGCSEAPDLDSSMTPARKAAKAAGKKNGDAKEAPFEERLEQLERIVHELENGELSLEAGVGRYKEGVELLKTLQSSLARAESKVEQLTEILRQELSDLEQPHEEDD